MNVHSALGPGLLESTYHACLEHEFRSADLQFGHQVRLPIVYGETQLEDFNVVHLRSGIRRVVNKATDDPPLDCMDPPR